MLPALAAALTLASQPALAAEPSFDWASDVWKELAVFRPSAELKAKMTGNDASARYDPPADTANADLYAVAVRLASGQKAADLLCAFMRTPNGQGAGSFETWVEWPAGDRAVGDVVYLDIAGPDDGSVAYVDPDCASGSFMVIAIDTEEDGTHPVNGARRWGVRTEGDRAIFWTAAVDSPSVPLSQELGGAWLQEKTWLASMRDIAAQAVAGGATVEAYYAHLDSPYVPGKKPAPKRLAPSDL